MIPSGIKAFCFFLKFNLLRRETVKYYHKLQKQQYFSVDELEHLNWQKRKQLLSYAYEKVPYYRRKFKDVGLHPEDIKNPEDYLKVPLLRKEDIRQNFNQIISEEAETKALRLSTTGGSTGEPLKVMFDKRVPLEALGWRLWSWWGIQPYANEASVMRRMPTERAHWVNAIRWWPASKIKLDASSIKNQDIEKFLNEFNQMRPELLSGYAGAIDYVASFIEDNSLIVLHPKAILVTSSPISDIQRKRIENVFHAPVYDQYGCGEVFWLAAQCQQRQALHMFYDARFIEFVDDCGHVQPVDTMGNVVITDLENYFFPIIRYMNGDMGRALSGKCPCGINFPLMDKVKGRQTDLVKLPNGTCLAGDYLTTIFDNFPDAVKGFQVQQKCDYSIKLLYIPNPAANGLSEVLGKVYNELIEKTESQVSITMEPVESISHDRGKLRYVVSELI
ncbi:MAG: hypothetical protein WC476_03065 [Phycisphaerae bacterium]|jgi:phenylacetate-CoA ligase